MCKIVLGTELCGLCYHDSRLCVVELQGSTRYLCMYEVRDDHELVPLHFVNIPGGGLNARVDGHRQQLYIPRLYSHGVSVVSWKNNRLTVESTLTCVGVCRSVGVLSPYRLCVCDRTSGSVSLVSVTDDTVTATLGKPVGVGDEKPRDTSVLGNSILVRYGDRKLVVHGDGESSPGTMVTWPAGLQSLWGMSSDGVSRFLLCHFKNNKVFILDVSGKVCDKISIDTDSVVWDCTVGDGKLWVGCGNGDIIVMSSQ